MIIHSPRNPPPRSFRLIGFLLLLLFSLLFFIHINLSLTDEELIENVPRVKKKNTAMKGEEVSDKNGRNENKSDESQESMTIKADENRSDTVERNAAATITDDRRRKFLDRPSLNFIGERHSGTNWMAEHLVDCFKGKVDIFSGYRYAW